MLAIYLSAFPPVQTAPSHLSWGRMATIGKRNLLFVIRESSPGLYLDGGELGEILLPGRYIPVAAIRDAWLVEQGAAVQVYFIAGDLTISATAVSLQRA